MSDAPEAKLVCMAGPSAGQEFSLDLDDLTLGRSPDNAICLPDPSVSRQHVRVRRMRGGWAVSDMGSGNGTTVNGQTLEGESMLRVGDVITLGDTELRYDEGTARVQAPNLEDSTLDL